MEDEFFWKATSQYLNTMISTTTHQILLKCKLNLTKSNFMNVLNGRLFPMKDNHQS
jgi:hypothetical protein